MLRLALLFYFLGAFHYAFQGSQLLQAAESLGLGGEEATGQFRLVSATSGSKGVEKDGRFIVQDPRTAFSIPEDKQVLVYFEWEGPLGPHHLQAVWKNPDGKAVVLSDLNYESKEKRFGAYFALTLDANVIPGIWTVDAKVDGQPAGSSSFQVTSNVKPPPPPTTQNPLSPGELYKLSTASTVRIEKLDAQRRRFGVGSAFFVTKETLATTFGVLDGASSLRAVLPNNLVLPVTGVAAWNRREDWALLKVTSPQDPAPLKTASVPAQVGDTCYSLDVAQETNRTIAEGAITGDAHLAGIGELLNISCNMQRAANGSPVLNDQGEVIGIAVSGVLLPGADAADTESAVHVTSMNQVATAGRHFGAR